MADLESLQTDELWTEALRLGKLLMRLGYAQEVLPQHMCESLRALATAIPRAIGEAHLAENMSDRIEGLEHARNEARRVETILAEAATEKGADLSHMVEAFVVADALRERLLLAQIEEQEMRCSA